MQPLLPVTDQRGSNGSLQQCFGPGGFPGSRGGLGGWGEEG
jgi:hypothetical protein